MGKDWGLLIIVGLLLFLLLKRNQVQQFSNEETWTWVDWQGRKRSITVHRNANAR